MEKIEISPCLSVVVPVYNEAATIANVLETVLAQRVVQEVVVVDDCSKDKTWEALQPVAQKDKRVKLYRHEVNQGKGAALRTGFKQATCPVVIIQDADLEYDPDEYEMIIRPIVANKADVVFGSRFAGAGAHRVLYYWHSLGNKVLTLLSNMATNLNLTDMETGYKAFRREVIQNIKIEENRFGFEPEITAWVAHMDLRIYEVPISYYGRTYAEGKKNWLARRRQRHTMHNQVQLLPQTDPLKERPNQHALTNNFEFDALREAENYRRALVREFSSSLHGRVIEIGAGIGQMTELMGKLPNMKHLQAIEPDGEFCKEFRRLHPKLPLIEGTVENIGADDRWNAIISINVLEHIRDDQDELKRYHHLLVKERGTVNLFVPARQEIYAPIDKDFGHHRRYTKAELRQKLEAAGFVVERLHYFNCVGYFAWWLNFCILKKRKFEVGSVRFYDRVVFPCVYGLESRFMFPPFGQSLMAIGRAK